MYMTGGKVREKEEEKEKSVAYKKLKSESIVSIFRKIQSKRI